VIPLSLACKSPEVVPKGSTCTLLVASDESSSLPAPPSSSSSSSSSKLNPRAAPFPPPAPAAASSSSSRPVVKLDLADAEEDPASRAKHEILRFIAGLRARHILSAPQAHLLEDFLLDSSTLLFAAYTVALSAKDSEYLSEILSDIAGSLETDEGRLAVEAQDEVCQVCDQLFIADKVTENQLLYLRHLVLIRDESVALIYDDFQSTNDVNAMAKALYSLANNHPHEQAAGSRPVQYDFDGEPIYDDDDEDEDDYDDDDSEDDEDDDDDSEYYMRRSGAIAPAPQQAPSSSSSSSASVPTPTLKDLLTQMVRSGAITMAEAPLLVSMIRGNDEYVVAAFELYEADGNFDELMDTLARCVKLEARRNAVLEREEGMRRDSRNSSMYVNAPADYDDEDEDDEDEDEDDEDDEDDDEDEDEEEEDPFYNAANVDAVLATLGVQNAWKNTVPTLFVMTVFMAAHKSLLSVGQAKALCDLFQAQYDLVRAAWEVYNVQGDSRDFTDTLRRIVRDLPFDSNGDLRINDSSVSVSAAAAAAKASEEKKAEDQENKRKVLAAVLEAKRNLLKHSLDMMVAQGSVTRAGADDLVRRAAGGDPLVDAAIDSYASERNVKDFLETLQLLASHSAEEIDAMLRSGAEHMASSAASPSPATAAAPAPAAAASSAAPAPLQEQARIDRAEDEEADKEYANMVALVRAMKNSSLITATQTNTLLRLLYAEDARALSVFDVFRRTHSSDELLDSLIRLSVHGAQPQDRDGEDEDDDDEDEDDEDEEDEDEDDEDEEDDYEAGKRPSASATQGPSSAILTPDDQKQVIGVLARAGTVDTPRLAFLNSLVDKRDPALARLFLQYEASKDVLALITGLGALAANAPTSSVSAPASASASTFVHSWSSAPEDDDDDEDEDDDEDDEDEEEDEEQLDADDSLIIEERLTHIVQGMRLNNLETAALRLAIARDDESVRQALAVFKTTRDEARLANTLRLISRATIEETLAGECPPLCRREKQKEKEGREDDEYCLTDLDPPPC